MEFFRMRRWLALSLVVAAPIMAVGGCGGKSSSHTASSTNNTSSHSSALVQGRSAKSTELSAPGLQITRGSFSVDLNNRSVVIGASDWNTITASSTVAHKLGVTLDSDFHASTTTRNRFQYLADRLVAVAQPRFVPVGIASTTVGSNDVAIEALLNPTADAYRLSGLHVTVIKKSPRTTLGSATFFSGAGQGIVIPARGVDFLRLTVPLSHKPPRPEGNELREETDFHYDRLFNCGTKGCG
jgi:hypothetical protein